MTDLVPKKNFKTLVDVAFNTLLHPFRSQSEPETILLYYTGHGLLKEGPWNQNGCTVTVQSACSQDEVNFYEFTQCFVHFNKPENYDSFRELKEKWNGKSEKEKNVFRQLYLVSPQLATTMPMTKLS